MNHVNSKRKKYKFELCQKFWFLGFLEINNSIKITTIAKKNTTNCSNFNAKTMTLGAQRLTLRALDGKALD